MISSSLKNVRMMSSISFSSFLYFLTDFKASIDRFSKFVRLPLPSSRSWNQQNCFDKGYLKTPLTNFVSPIQYFPNTNYQPKVKVSASKLPL